MNDDRQGDPDLFEADDPTDPDHPDYDLSVAAPAYLIEEPRPWFLQRWFLLSVAVLVISGLVLPYLLIL